MKTVENRVIRRPGEVHNIADVITGEQLDNWNHIHMNFSFPQYNFTSSNALITVIGTSTRICASNVYCEQCVNVHSTYLRKKNMVRYYKIL